jgi:sigma-E factor negative regulatory protein RseA
MKEKISELMDGELEDGVAAMSIDGLERSMASGGQEGEAFEAWRTYHLIGDALRDTRTLSAGFAARVAERLAAEPTVLAPRRSAPSLQEPRKWYALPAAAAAGFAAIGLVGWLALAPQPQAPQQSPAAFAQAVPVPQVSGSLEARKPAIVPLPTATPDYLLAHQGFSPRTSLQGMAPYARTVSAQANEGRR